MAQAVLFRDGRTWSARETRPLKVYRGIHTWYPNRVTHMGTSLTTYFKNSLAERPRAGGLDRVCPVRELSGEFKH